VRHHESYSDSIAIRVEGDESVTYVVGHSDLFKQLLLNLAINACDAFEGSAGHITIRVLDDDRDGKVKLLVCDDGPGMPPGVRERVFEPFYSTKRQGTGLGLAIVHRICSLLKLELQIETEPGRGTSFSIGFRRYQPPVSASPSAASRLPETTPA